MAWNNPPLFLSKLGDPDKWFITLNWSDTKSSVGGVTSGDADWTNNKLSIAEYRLTKENPFEIFKKKPASRAKFFNHKKSKKHFRY